MFHAYSFEQNRLKAISSDCPMKCILLFNKSNLDYSRSNSNFLKRTIPLTENAEVFYVII
jgi:hypothetical protein